MGLEGRAGHLALPDPPPVLGGAWFNERARRATATTWVMTFVLAQEGDSESGGEA